MILAVQSRGLGDLPAFCDPDMTQTYGVCADSSGFLLKPDGSRVSLDEYNASQHTSYGVPLSATGAPSGAASMLPSWLGNLDSRTIGFIVGLAFFALLLLKGRR